MADRDSKVFIRLHEQQESSMNLECPYKTLQDQSTLLNGYLFKIRMCSKDQNRAGVKKKLKQDIHNVIHQTNLIFFLNQQELDNRILLKAFEDDEMSDDMLEEQARYWKEITDYSFLSRGLQASCLDSEILNS